MARASGFVETSLSTSAKLVFALIGRPLNVGWISSGRYSIPSHFAIRRIVASVSESSDSNVTTRTSRFCLPWWRRHLSVPSPTFRQCAIAASRSAQRGSQRFADAYQVHGSRRIEITLPSGKISRTAVRRARLRATPGSNPTTQRFSPSRFA